MLKIANIGRESLQIFWTNRGISMKFSRKMWLMIILKVTKNQGFTLYLEDSFLENQNGGVMGSNRSSTPPATPCPTAFLGLILIIIFIKAILMLLFWSDSDFWLGKLNLENNSKSKLWSILQITMKLLTFKSKKNDFLIRITWKPKEDKWRINTNSVTS